MDITIRQADLADKDSLIPFRIMFTEQNSAYEGGRVTEKTKHRLAEDLDENIKKQKIWVAEVDNKIVGLIFAEIPDTLPDNLYLDSLFVDIPYRHQGVATKLINFVEDFFKRKGAGKSWLYVAKQNPEAESLYQKLGYQYQEDPWKKYQKKL